MFLLLDSTTRVQFKWCTKIGDTTVSMSQIRTYLTELAANCSFSSPDVLKSSPNPRGQRTILKDLYMHLSPASASIVTQIILKDLRPLLYPLHKIHYSTSLSKYKSNAVKMLTKEDAMMAWDPSGRMLRSFKVQGTLSSVTTLDEGREGVIAPQIGIPVSVCRVLDFSLQTLNSLRHRNALKGRAVLTP